MKKKILELEQQLRDARQTARTAILIAVGKSANAGSIQGGGYGIAWLCRHRAAVPLKEDRIH